MGALPNRKRRKDEWRLEAGGPLVGKTKGPLKKAKVHMPNETSPLQAVD
jgi:hypothetical protein